MTARAYFDHNATTPLDPRVEEALQRLLRAGFGNASCLYQEGVEAAYRLEKARIQTASLIGARAEEIAFTSGGTESDNLAIQGAVLASGKREVVISAIEHPAVTDAAQWLQTWFGCAVRQIPVDEQGVIRLEEAARLIGPDTALVSVMMANNETGAIQPIAELAALTRERGVLLHSDAVQAGGRLAIDVEPLGVDLLSLSGHKMHGPKGVGALYVRQGTPMEAILGGGGHEQGLRPGTENVPGLAAMGHAAQLAENELDSRQGHLAALEERLREGLQQLDWPKRIHSPAGRCLPGTVNVSFAGVPGRNLVRAMDEQGFAIATGSACSTGKATPSTVLRAMGRSDEEATCSVRISLGAGNQPSEVDAFLEALPLVLQAISQHHQAVSQASLQ